MMWQMTSNEKQKTYQRALWTVGLFAAVFVLTTVAYLLLKPYIELHHRGMIAQCFMAVCIGILCVVTAYLGMSKRLTFEKFMWILLAVGFVLRLGYVLYTAGSARQHDTFTKNEDGHEAYAWILFTTGKLPTSNVYQFYHPPLNAMVQAAFMRWMQGFTQTLTKWFSLGDYFPAAFAFSKPEYIDETRYFLFSSCQILGVMYAFITAYFSVKLICQFSFSNKTKGLLAAFIWLFPRNIQMSGMLNNDALAYMFAIVAVYACVKWYQSKSWQSIVACALCVGFGLMTKLSSATVCLLIAGVFIYQFIRDILTKDKKIIFKTVLQYGTFLVICAPIGLWFQVYAYKAFGQEFGYVFANLNSALSTADKSWFERFVFAFDAQEYFGLLFCRPFENYNLFNYTIRNAVFGEFTYWQGEGFGTCAVIFGTLLVFMIVIGEIVCLIHRIKGYKRTMLSQGGQTATKRSWLEIAFVALFTISQIGSFVYFNMSMPYGCTMDYRYILPMTLALALTLGMVQEGLQAKNTPFCIELSRCLTIASIGFVVCSALFYCTCI